MVLREKWDIMGSTEVHGHQLCLCAHPKYFVLFFLILEGNEWFRDDKTLFRRNDKADLLVSGGGVIFMNFNL